jgi:hypothetical protein
VGGTVTCSPEIEVSARPASSPGCKIPLNFFLECNNTAAGLDSSIGCRTAQWRKKMNAPKITFFMLVTDRDVSIADYAAKSYTRIHR